MQPRTTSVLSEGDVSFDGMETKSFEELTASNKDGLRRKSMMPSNKKVSCMSSLRLTKSLFSCECASVSGGVLKKQSSSRLPATCSRCRALS